jgi:Tfp pilus assembly protein PilF
MASAKETAALAKAVADEAAATALENCVECAPEEPAPAPKTRPGTLDYSRWDDLYDSDEEAKREKAAKAKAAKEARLAQMRNPAPAAPAMTEEETMKMIQERPELYGCCTAGRKPYKFPETEDEQGAKIAEADALRKRGNELYGKGELVEAAKLYEQAVLKFADWYAECFATDEEKARVHAVKLPCHLNLAACSMRLGNLQHAVVHCSQVVDNDASNAKALFRRGVCHTKLGNLDAARDDLRKAAELDPTSREVRAAAKELKEKRAEYAREAREIAGRMVQRAAGDESDEEEEAAAEEAAAEDGAGEGGDAAAEADDAATVAAAFGARPAIADGDYEGEMARRTAAVLRAVEAEDDAPPPAAAPAASASEAPHADEEDALARVERLAAAAAARAAGDEADELRDENARLQARLAELEAERAAAPGVVGRLWGWWRGE